MLNAAKLRGKIAEVGISITALAAKMGIDPATLHRKSKGKTEFSRREIQTLSTELHLTVYEVKDIFFADKLA